jgi:anti-sigma regulatory factor (Ser/Thr protein kinase)
VCSIHRDITRTFVNDARAAAAARRLVAGAARGHVPPRQRDVAILLVSEAVTNSVVHAHSPDVTVTVSCNGTTLAVTVTDRDPSLPHVAATDPLDEGGRGLLLMDFLAAEWGVRPLAAGKQVWFRT